jgi:hypothetical protein
MYGRANLDLLRKRFLLAELTRVRFTESVSEPVSTRQIAGVRGGWLSSLPATPSLSIRALVVPGSPARCWRNSPRRCARCVNRSSNRAACLSHGLGAGGIGFGLVIHRAPSSREPPWRRYARCLS